MVAATMLPDTFPILGPLTERADGPSGPWLIMEGGRGGKVSCFVDTYRLEERTNGKGWVKELPDGRFRVKAKAQHTGVKNRNGRVYPRHVWEQHLKESAPFRKSLGTRRVIGHLEHPEDGKSQFPLGAIVITEGFAPDENGEVFIIFETMSTPAGKIVEAYIRSRVGFGLSSRGNGSVVTRNGVDEVQEDYEPVTWDCVIQESTIGAEVEALRESWQDRPGTPDEFATFLQEARDELVSYVDRVIASSQGDHDKARALVEADNRKAAHIIDCVGGVCKCQITETVTEDVPPSGYSRYLLAFEDGSAHYRAYQGTTGQWEVWMHPHNLRAERLGSKIPTLAAAHQVAENHYGLILAGGAMSAQTHAARSNAIADDATSLAMSPVAAPNPIGGMAGMMGRHGPPVGPAAATGAPPQSVQMPGGRTPSKITLSFESVLESLDSLDERTPRAISQAIRMLKGRRCFSRKEAIAAAKSIERSLKSIERTSQVRGSHKKGILQLLWWARNDEKPEDAIDHITQALDMLRPLYTHGVGSRTLPPEKDVRLGKLLGASLGSRLEAVRTQWADRFAELQEVFKLQQSIPFSGTVCVLELSSGEETKKAREALEESGFFCEEVDSTHIRVYTTFDDEEQACHHIERVLRGKGMRYEQTEAVGIVEDGQVFLEDDMGDLIEYAPDKRAPGPGMGGGDTVPDEPEDAGGAPATSGTRSDRTDRYQGIDPEDLDLDLDVNECGEIDYPYEMAEQKLKRGVLTPVNTAARRSAGMPEPKKKQGIIPLTKSARRSMGMNELGIGRTYAGMGENGGEYDDDDDDDDDGMDYDEADSHMDYDEADSHMDYDDDDDDDAMEGDDDMDSYYESVLDEAPGGAPGRKAMFAKAFARTPRSKSTGKPKKDSQTASAARGSKGGKKYYRGFRSEYAGKYDLKKKPIIGRGERKANPAGPAQRRRNKKKNESILSEAPGGAQGRKAMFAKAFARTPRSKSTGKPKKDSQTASAARGSKGGKKYYRGFRSEYATKNNLKKKPIIGRGERKANPAGPAQRRRNKKKKNESVFVRHRDDEVIGAVRVFENIDHMIFEYYNSEGILEGIFDHDGDAIYVAESAEYFDNNMVSEGTESYDGMEDGIEVWENIETGEEFGFDIFEEELPARHGGKTGVATKGDAYMGKAGPEYNIPDLPDGGDRGPSGPGLKPGTYDRASEEGDGKYLKKGTWPTSGDPAGGIPKRNGKDDDEDGDGGAAAKKMAEHVAYLESELAFTQDQLSEQTDELDAMHESQTQAELDHARARLFASHPELRLAEDRFLRCESVEEIRDEANAMIRLVEAQAPAPAPSVVTKVQTLNEVQKEPTLASLANRDNVVTSQQLQEAMGGSLNETIFSSGGPGGSRSRDVGNVASRTAAHRKRRLRSRRS